MRSILSEPLDKRLALTAGLALTVTVVAVGLVLVDLYEAAWFGLGLATVLSVVAIVMAPRRRWVWVAVVAVLAVMTLVVAGWVAPPHGVAGTANHPVVVGAPGIVMTSDEVGYIDDLNSWEITVTDVYQGEAVIPTVEGDISGTCWFVVGVVRPVEGIFPASPPLARQLTFDNGDTVPMDASSQCVTDLEGPEAGVFYHQIKTDRAVTFALGFPALDSNIRPVHVEFLDAHTSQRAVFEVPG